MCQPWRIMPQDNQKVVVWCESTGFVYTGGWIYCISAANTVINIQNKFHCWRTHDPFLSKCIDNVAFQHRGRIQITKQSSLQVIAVEKHNRNHFRNKQAPSMIRQQRAFRWQCFCFERDVGSSLRFFSAFFSISRAHSLNAIWAMCKNVNQPHPITTFTSNGGH